MVPALVKVSHLEGNEIGADAGLPVRLASFLAHVHPHHTAKSVQAHLIEQGVDVGLDAIKKWVSGGAWPTWPAHLEGLLSAYGQDFVEAVLLPSVWSAEDNELARISRAEAELAARRERMEAARTHRRQFLGRD